MSLLKTVERSVLGRLDRASLKLLNRTAARSPARARALVPWVDMLASYYLRHEDVTDGDREILDAVRPYTLVNAMALNALLQAVDYVVSNRIPGAFVECGTYRGGCGMAMARKLRNLGDESREIVLFDTFEGAPRPESANDRLSFGASSAQEVWDRARSDAAQSHEWFRDVYAEARGNMDGTGYPPDRIRLVRGLVEETIPQHAPEQIAILRLDTDWYESTIHELRELYPRLSPGGVVIIDDYGALTGARKATDDYFADAGVPRPLLQRINFTVRQGIKI